ncbi:MAG: LamG domain-containing protein, partial [Chromatiales bacterium]|nr:LamG domain-containing protein [Chromatiales bacterium]
SRKGDREKFRSSMTVAAWVKTQQPNRTTYLLRQPYTNKEGNLIAFSISEDGTISFELVTNGKHQKLESGTLDKKLWGQWIHIAASWDGRDECGKAVLYVNGESIAQSCLGRPLSAENTNDLLLGETQDSTVDNANTLIDDVAIWRQPLMPMQIDAVYKLGDRFSYNASEVDALFNTPEKDGITQIGEHQWQRTTLEQTPNAAQLTIRVLPNATEIQFGDVMAIRCLSCIPS